MSDYPRGVLQYTDLRQRGWTDGEIATSVRHGRLTRLLRGTYLNTDGPVDHLDLSRAVWQRSPDFVISHASAAVVHGFPVRITGRTVDLTHPRGGPGRRQPHRVVHADRLTSDDIIEMNGLRVTSVARTLVDLCRTQPYGSAVVVADHVLHRRLTTTDLILAALESQHHRRGMPGARRALAFADGRAESPGESRMRLMFEKCGFALPELQVLVLGDNGKVLARADAADLEDNCLYEYDGRVKYSDPFRGSGVDALMDEKRREDLVRSHGRAFCRLTADDLSEEIFRARVERARAIGQSLAASGAVRGRLVTTPARTLPLS